MRRGAVRRTLRPARLRRVLYFFSMVIVLGAADIFLRMAARGNEIMLFGAVSCFLVFFLLLPFPRSYSINAMLSYLKVFRQYYIPLALEKSFSDLQIQQGGGVSRGTITNTGMMYPGKIIESQSIIRGRYRGVPFEQSTLRIDDPQRRGGRRGRRRRGNIIVFRGLWTVVSLNGSYQPELQIIQSGFCNKESRLSFHSRYTIGRRVSTKSLGFNLRFRVYALDPGDVDYVLTPKVMKQIQNLAVHTKGLVMLGFTDGKLHLAVQTKYAAFSPPNIFLPFREEKAVAQIQREIAPFTRLIDELSLDNDLFKREDSI